MIMLIYTKEYNEDYDEKTKEETKSNILKNLIFMLSYTKKLDIKMMPIMHLIMLNHLYAFIKE